MKKLTSKPTRVRTNDEVPRPSTITLRDLVVISRTFDVTVEDILKLANR